ncbi:MAG: amidohydrolase [Acidimicrobiaceae bacterium]|nr:amidohydrolase [Acidimicrobiaceae bacterium]
MTVIEDRIQVVDADTHLTEPADLWTARIPRRFRDRAPRVARDEVTGGLRWRIGDRWCSLVGNYSVAGWRELPPSCPPTLDEADPACYDAGARLAHMDRQGIHAQVLYPNVIAFEGHAFMALDDEALKIACVQTYNDYLSEFASAAPDRFILLATLPFWDLDASLAELRRCRDMGHRGVLWATTLDKHGLPSFTDPYWDPLYAAAQDMGMSVNFHVGVGNTAEEIEQAMNREHYDPAFNAARSSMTFIGNARNVGLLLTSGLCDRFPRLDFVLVESGFGYIPFLLDSLDWQWTQSGAPVRYPDRLLPSEYFRRQVYTMFWFEQEALALVPNYQDNVMFETDFPHPTCLHPGPANAPSPAEVIRRDTEILGEGVMRKVLQDNAWRVYHLG